MSARTHRLLIRALAIISAVAALLGAWSASLHYIAHLLNERRSSDLHPVEIRLRKAARELADLALEAPLPDEPWALAFCSMVSPTEAPFLDSWLTVIRLYWTTAWTEGRSITTSSESTAFAFKVRARDASEDR